MATSKATLSKNSKIIIDTKAPKTVAVSFDSATKKMSRATGSWITDGIKVGDTLFTTDASNPGPLTVSAVVALDVTFAEAVVTVASANKTITAFTKVSEVVKIDTPEQQTGDIDVTNLESTAKEYKNSLPDGGTIAGEGNFVPDDIGQQLLMQLRGESEPRAMKIIVPPDADSSGYMWGFDGLVKSAKNDIAVDSKVNFQFSIRVSGAVTETVLAPTG